MRIDFVTQMLVRYRVLRPGPTSLVPGLFVGTGVGGGAGGGAEGWGLDGGAVRTGALAGGCGEVFGGIGHSIQAPF